jgi:nitrite reductase/ring-hydroxylating ferredoxin subunit
LTKAKPLPANEETQNSAPRVVCDFCKSTYNLKTGAKLESQQGGGIFGGIAKAVLGAQSSSPLKIYQLGEGKNNKIMFSMDDP